MKENSRDIVFVKACNSKPVVAIIDYGMGNLYSVEKACEHVGFEAHITQDEQQIVRADAVILPGVGAFGDAMQHLREFGLITPIKEFIKSGRPFMGICLGMQLLMRQSEEFGIHEGLGIIDGTVTRFSSSLGSAKTIKVPQVGWNRIFLPPHKTKDCWAESPLRNLESGECMYFVHSYHVNPTLQEMITSITIYGDTEYCSSLHWKNIFATQFHPEKSAEKGIQIYKNWFSMVQQLSKNP